MIDQCGGGSFLQNFRVSALLILQVLLLKNACNFVSWVAKSCGSTPPRDRPNSLYFFPVLYDTESFVKDIDIEELEQFDDPDFIREFDEISDDFKEFVSVFLDTAEIRNNPQSVNERLHLYFILLEVIATYS